MAQLTDLINEREELKAKLGRVNSEISSLQLHLVEEKWHVAVGTIVGNHKGKEYRIRVIQPHGINKPWVKGNPRRKDGTFGTALHHLYDNWQLLP